MSRPRSEATTTEASRVYGGLIDPKPEGDGWSSVCPRHKALIQVRVRIGRLHSIHCSGAEGCAEVKRLRKLAGK